MSIIRAGLVAIELRKLADALDKEPDTTIVRPNIYFMCSYVGDFGKAAFLSLAKLLPRPLVKRSTNNEYQLVGENDAIRFEAAITRSQVCTLVEPAKPAVYDCPSILSEAEEAALGEESLTA
jgi:hypothetical protein